MPKMKSAIESMTVTRLLPNICTNRMEATRDFYVNLLGFVVGFEHPGWYIQLSSTTDPQLQIGILRQDYEFIPPAFQKPAQGVVISVQVEDVDAAYAKVREGSFDVAQEMCDESFGMRCFMVADPNGLLINIFSFP